jgi:hypothetical protein
MPIDPRVSKERVVMAELTRQDVNQMIEAAKNNILQRLPDRNDLSVATNNVRERLLAQMIESSGHQQNILNRSNAQRTQLIAKSNRIGAEDGFFREGYTDT